MAASSRLRILQVLRAPVGGLFRHVADLTRGLVGRGHEVGLVMDAADAGPRWESVIVELAALAPLGLTRIPMARGPSFADLSAIAHVARRIATQGIDVVHGHGAKGGAYARIAGTLGRKHGRPVRIYTPHGGSLHFPRRSLEGCFYHTLERLLARASEAILFESAFAKRGFAEMLGLEDPSWPIIPNGLLPAEFEPIRLIENPADIVFVGEMRRLKGVDLLIEALACLPASTTALFVGGGPDEAAFRMQASTLGLDQRVTFAAPMPAREAFARGRVVVMPSRAESLPYLALEAIAAGRPLIATRVGGIPEIFGAEAQSLVPPNEVEALRAAMAAACAAPDVALARAERLQAFVKDRFDVAKMIDAVIAAYRAKLDQ